MKDSNLVWAIGRRRLAHNELATRIKMDPSRFSRCLNGRFEFAPHERSRIAEALGFDDEWLFREPLPPGRSAQLRGDSGVVSDI